MNEPNNAVLERAILIAVQQHSGQTDKNGEAYILHPLRVMQAVRERGGSLSQQAAAMLHDVVEDCAITEAELRMQLPSEVCDIVLTLTHGNNDLTKLT